MKYSLVSRSSPARKRRIEELKAALSVKSLKITRVYARAKNKADAALAISAEVK